MSVERPSEPVCFRPRGTSEVSLHERFSRVLVEQETCSRLATFDPILLQHTRMPTSPPVVLLLKTVPLSLLHHQAPVSSSRAELHHLSRRRSVWTRLGWQQVTRRLSTSRPRGFWSFMNKYSWRGMVTSTCRRSLRSRLGHLRFLRPASVGTQASGRRWRRLTLKKGGATALKRPGTRRKKVAMKKQLDAELDEYMSLSRHRLDKQLDDYMSMSRSRLDAELDEYMSMAGQSQKLWD
ncbi:uncharacterized protein LOC115794600 [Archocentrus centrarchus]|uniref:uncharacterized protein LOC115794600 n=1 Tax=Archocentrus centrarchus TaxID=63155 RepID=UPI0011EA197C|nr:uncharacterized protein LOC115794600 [Archocentrus centrarchus]XP_030606055.1 uncharacterized protein LOC115794600 [Archocentrus centrarchus]XP_030606056.1 uncharacterized protein LOC115794600 [Archocentrus centrarchus]XP_030606057.1 uncharacterized protein LOC115794600 [Archocentrus centrarchus]XP_030606058.1 uncharacterized protein LOC115794600 [Archocentrus centrarchus]XP_030606060.1 uncharacterized protein LOC115794600 [Archocentrus centrarchus]XP_030606061.1 uncharacterized protein LO